MPTKVTYNPMSSPGCFSRFLPAGLPPDPAYQWFGPSIWETYDQVYHSGSVPGWREKIKAGESATSTLTGTRYGYTGGNCNATLLLRKHVVTGAPGDYATVKFWGGWGVGSISPSVPDIPLDDILSAAASSFVNRARKEQRALQGAVSVGELAQTLRMIKRPMQSLRRKLDDYLGDVQKNAKGKSSKRAKNNAIADTWLEHNLGWRPLLSDLEGLADAAGRHQTEESRKGISGGKSQQKMQPANYLKLDVGPEMTFHRRWQIIDRVSVRFVGQVRVKGGNPGVKDLLGVSRQDVLPTIWELIPWSFVVDYFVNIGQMVDALSMFGSDLIWAERRMKSSRSTVYLPPTATAKDSGTWKVLGVECSGGGAVCWRDEVDRRAQAGWPVPSIQFRIPGLGQPRQWVNLAALAASSRRASYAIAG